MFDVSLFLDQLKQGGMRPSLFNVYIDSYEGKLDGFEFKCKSTRLPASVLEVIETHYFGRTIKLPGVRSYENWTCTIIADENQDIRAKLERWLDAINGANENVNNTGGPGNHARSATIQTYSQYQDSKVKSKYNIRKMFPVNVGEIELNWESGNEIATFDVEFAFLNFSSTHNGGNTKGVVH